MAGSAAAPTCAARRHLAPASPHAEKIVWFAQTHADNARVERWSCHVHDKPDYELCVLGAVWFIRMRTAAGGIHETHREPPALTQELWHRLLAGSAR